MAEVSSYIEGKRWSKLTEMVHAFASKHNCQVMSIAATQRSWLNERVNYTVTGNKTNLGVFEISLLMAVEKCGGRMHLEDE